MKHLMDEFQTLEDTAKKNNEFGQAQIFSHAVSYANQTHVLNNQQTIDYVKNAISSMPTTHDEGEEDARDEAMMVVDLFEEILSE